jgi:hypothetical protein
MKPRNYIATNETESPHDLVAFNSVELNETGQIVIPYGEQPVNSVNLATRERKQVVQRLDKSAAEKIAANFASLLQRAKRMVFGEVPVYVGHPDVFPKEFPDNRAYGWVKGMTATNEALVVDVEWNSLGAALVADKTYRWPSPAWDLEETATKSANGLPVVVPSRIFSIGMTNQPNWKTVAAINDAAAGKMVTCEACGEECDYAAQTEISAGAIACPKCGAHINQEGKKIAANQKEDPMNKTTEFLLQLLGLNADATEEQIKTTAAAKLTATNEVTSARDQAVKDLATERTAWAAKKAEFTGAIAKLETQLAAANDATVAARAARADYALSVAVNDGRITPADKDGLKTKLVACNDDTAYIELDKLPKKVKTESVAANVASRKAEAAGSESGVQAIVAAVNAEMAKSGTDWDTAYQATKKTQPALFTKNQ